MKHVFVFVPAFGQQVSATTFMTTHNLQQVLASKSIGGSISTLSFPDIAELRSMVFSIWYDTMPQCDYLLFVDADMGFDPNMVIDMILLDEPIVGSIYRQRKDTISWAGSGNGAPQTERRGNFMRVEGVGMGCTLIRRDVGDLMLAKYPELIDLRLSLHPAFEMIKQAGCNRLFRIFEKMNVPERGIVSEDLSFCLRWNQIGGSVWAAIGYPISHVGPYDYRGCYLESVQQHEARLQEQQLLQPPQLPREAVKISAAESVQAVPASLTMQNFVLPQPPKLVPPIMANPEVMQAQREEAEKMAADIFNAAKPAKRRRKKRNGSDKAADIAAAG